MANQRRTKEKKEKERRPTSDHDKVSLLVIDWAQGQASSMACTNWLPCSIQNEPHPPIPCARILITTHAHTHTHARRWMSISLWFPVRCGVQIFDLPTIPSAFNPSHVDLWGIPLRIKSLKLAHMYLGHICQLNYLSNLVDHIFWESGIINFFEVNGIRN